MVSGEDEHRCHGVRLPVAGAQDVRVYEHGQLLASRDQVIIKNKIEAIVNLRDICNGIDIVVS